MGGTQFLPHGLASSKASLGPFPGSRVFYCKGSSPQVGAAAAGTWSELIEVGMLGRETQN